jgi:FixJ family two-component response regulator
MTNPRSTVFIVDDDGAIRDSVGNLIRSVGLDVRLFGSAQEFLGTPEPDVPACVVLDVRLPGLSGLDCQRQLAEAGFRVPIVFISAHGDIPMSVRAMKDGAMDFIIKPFRDQDLLDAVQHALERDRRRRENERETAGLRERLASLTMREREVLEWVIGGRLNKQIAGALGTSEVTVKVHRGQVMRKMHADSVADLVRIAGRLGIEPRT